MAASLAAVRAASDAAKARLRRDTRKVRLLTVAVLAAIGVPALMIAKNRPGARGGEPVAPAAAATVATDPGASPGASSPAPRAVAEDVSPTHAPPAAAPAPEAALPAMKETEAPAVDPAEAIAACLKDYEAHRWPLATDTCARAASLRPHDPALAMKVAQAYHARGRYADAGVWAQRALQLDGVDPEALVILAHAERRAGRAVAARDAYRRYLALAPRGWHAAEARAAVRPGTAARLHARAEAPAASSEAPFASSAESNADQH
jgi:Flp pilus assembly protein TadD